MNSKEHNFSFETNFERTTDEFWKNVIRTNDLARYDMHELTICQHFRTFNLCFEISRRSTKDFWPNLTCIFLGRQKIWRKNDKLCKGLTCILSFSEISRRSTKDFLTYILSFFRVCKRFARRMTRRFWWTKFRQEEDRPARCGLTNTSTW